MIAAIEIKTAIQYLMNAEGEKTGVLIPMEIWEQLKPILHKYQEMERIKEDIKEGMKEAEAIKRGEIKGISLKEFIEELEAEEQLSQQQKLKEIEDGVRESVEEYKKMREGKFPTITMKEFLDEL